MEKPAETLLVRKRKYRSSLSDESVALSKSELHTLQKRKISPSTSHLIDNILEQWEELEAIPSDDLHRIRKCRTDLYRAEIVLESYLEKDIRHADTLTQFKEMMSKQFILRYGDYLKNNLSMLKNKSASYAKTGELEVDFLRGRLWRDLIKDLDEEDTNLKIWKESAEVAKARGVEVPGKPSSSTRNFLLTLSELVGWEYDHVIFEIREYQRRNDTAHSGLEDAIRNLDYKMIAEYIVRDRQQIVRGILPGEKGLKAGLLEALEIFEKKYFKSIEVEEDEDKLLYGVLKVGRIELSEEEKSRWEKRAEKGVQKTAENLEKLVLEQLAVECQEQYELELKDELRQADTDLRSAEDAFKLAQKTLEERRKTRNSAYTELKKHRVYLKKQEDRA